MRKQFTGTWCVNGHRLYFRTEGTGKSGQAPERPRGPSCFVSGCVFHKRFRELERQK